jgi:hypothetical protein
MQHRPKLQSVPIHADRLPANAALAAREYHSASAAVAQGELSLLDHVSKLALDWMNTTHRINLYKCINFERERSPAEGHQGDTVRLGSTSAARRAPPHPQGAEGSGRFADSTPSPNHLCMLLMSFHTQGAGVKGRLLTVSSTRPGWGLL